MSVKETKRGTVLLHEEVRVSEKDVRLLQDMDEGSDTVKSCSRNNRWL